MDRENEDKSVRDFAKRKKRYRRTRNMLIVLLLLAVSVIGVLVIYSINNRSYHGYKEIHSKELKGETTIGFLNFGSSVVKYGKDGVIAYNKEGKVQWNSAYNMSDPVADSCEDYVVVADRGNKQVRVFDKKGSVAKYSSEYNILKVEVANQGVVAILMEEGNYNHIRLYDLEGNVLAERVNSVKAEDGGYPLDISLSSDGKKLAVSYLSLTKNKEYSRVGFYNFGEVGKNKDNRYVGGFNTKEGVIATRIEFVNNDTVCVFKNDGLELYRLKELPQKVKDIPIKNTIKSILYNKKYCAIVTQAEGVTDKRLLLFNLDGETVLDKELDFEYKKIFLSYNEVIAFDDLNCNIIRKNGKVKFRYKFDGSITDLYPINGNDRYYLVNANKLSVIELTN